MKPAVPSHSDTFVDPKDLWDTGNPRLHLGTQRFLTSEEHLEFLVRHGVEHMALNRMPLDRDIGWDVDWLAGERERCARFGVTWRWWRCPFSP
ncbi:MAG: hypothetical protein VX733_10455 [Candidatus Latescibacterota bacterium]|nr:hypothetical protein [Candidatus Latescibacterota bacterium]